MESEEGFSRVTWTTPALHSPRPPAMIGYPRTPSVGGRSAVLSFLGASLSRSQSIEPLADRAWEAIRRPSRTFVPRHLRHLRDRSREQGKGSWQVTIEHPEDASGAVSVSVERDLKRHLEWLLELHHCVTVQMVTHLRSPGATRCIEHCSLGSGTCKLRESVSGRSVREA